VKFVYRAKKSDKSIQSGELEANSEKEVIRSLEAQGLVPIEIQQVQTQKKQRVFKTPSKKIVLRFTEQLASLINAGVNILQSFDVLIQQAEDERMKNVLTDIRTSLKDGASLSDAVKGHPKCFSNFYTNMIRSGEMSGTLDQVLLRLTDFHEKEDEIRNKIVTALVYPAFISFVGFAAIAVLLIMVVPRITSIFIESGQSLPLSTQILLSVSDMVVRFWWGILGFLIFIYLLFKQRNSTPEGRLALHKIRLHIPIVGMVHRDDQISKFMRTMATLLENGIPIVSALEITKDIAENEILRKEIEEMIQNVRKGAHMSDSLADSSFFPLSAVSMIAVGETSGNLEYSLTRMSASYERIVDRSVKTITTLLEPVLILVIGVLVAGIVFAMLMPILQINMIAF